MVAGSPPGEEIHSYEYDIQGNTVLKRLSPAVSHAPSLLPISHPSQNQAAHIAFVYDADNRLVQATRTWEKAGSPTEQTARYHYDAFGRRIAKQVTEQGDAASTTDTTLFVWDGDVMVQEVQADSTITYLYEPGSFVPLARVQSKEGIASYVQSADENSTTDAMHLHLPQPAQWGLPQDRHAADAHLASYRAYQADLKELAHQAAWQSKLDSAKESADTDTILHYQCDHLGTPLELIDETGKVVWAARYKAWGRVLRYDKREVEQPLRFQGQYEDAETGLFYNRHRYYDPDQARHITQDPIGLLGGQNCYQYAPSPTAWVDPLGLAKTKGGCDPCCGNDPSKEARSKQGPANAPYIGIDSYKNVVLQAGTKLYSLAPGGGPGFAVRGNTLNQAGGDAAKYHDMLQVQSKNLPPGRSMRTEVNEYILTEDICVAKGKALNNRQFGAGGATQFYVPASEQGKLLQVGRIPI